MSLERVQKTKNKKMPKILGDYWISIKLIRVQNNNEILLYLEICSFAGCSINNARSANFYFIHGRMVQSPREFFKKISK